MTGSSSSGLLATGLDDFIAEKFKESKLDQMIKEDNECAKRLAEDFKKINTLTEYVATKKNMTDYEKANVFVFVAAVKGLGFLSGDIGVFKQLKSLKVGIEEPLDAMKQFLGVISRSLGMLSALVTILNCENSWLTVNPNREKAEKAKDFVEGSLKQLQELQNFVDGVASLKDEA